jgi:hypothetical protein
VINSTYKLVLKADRLSKDITRTDTKVVLHRRGEVLTEINLRFGSPTSPPPPPEIIVAVKGTIKTTNHDREGRFCILNLRGPGENDVVWSHRFPEYPVWEDRHSEPFAFDKLSIAPPANMRFLVILTQEGASERSILRCFDVDVEFITNRGNKIRFSKTDLQLRTDNDHKTVAILVDLKSPPLLPLLPMGTRHAAPDAGRMFALRAS